MPVKDLDEALELIRQIRVRPDRRPREPGRPRAGGLVRARAGRQPLRQPRHHRRHRAPANRSAVWGNPPSARASRPADRTTWRSSWTSADGEPVRRAHGDRRCRPERIPRGPATAGSARRGLIPRRHPAGGGRPGKLLDQQPGGVRPYPRPLPPRGPGQPAALPARPAAPHPRGSRRLAVRDVRARRCGARAVNCEATVSLPRGWSSAATDWLQELTADVDRGHFRHSSRKPTRSWRTASARPRPTASAMRRRSERRKTCCGRRPSRASTWRGRPS